MIFGRLLPGIEIAWVVDLDAAREAVWCSPRIAGFILDYRIGRETCEPVLHLIRHAYPPPTPLYILTGFADDPTVARLAALHHAVLVEKGGATDFGRLPEAVARSRQRLFAQRDRLRARAHPQVLSPREMQVAELYAAGVPRHGLRRAIGADVDPYYVTDLTAALVTKLHCGSLDELLEMLGRLV